MKHNNFFKTISAFLLLGLIVLASSCSHNIFDKASDVTQIKPVLGGSERTVFPDFDLDELYGIKLEAKKNGYTGGWVQLAIWDNTDALSAIDIEPGTYSFQLTAYQGEVEFIATTSGVKIEKGKVNSVNFALVVNTWGDPDTDRGNIRINVSWAADINAISNSVTLSRVDTDGTENNWYTDTNVKVYYDNESKDGGWFINYSKYDLPVGEYKIDVVVTDENYKRGFYSDYIIVAAECTSANSFVIKDWTDIYAIASVLYSNESKHVKAEPDPNGKGVKFTFTYEEGDPDYWFDIFIEEEKSGIIWYYNIWDSGENTKLILAKNGLKKFEVVYPFVEDNENYIFNVNFSGGNTIIPHDYDDGKDYISDFWINETVISQANGGDTSILYDDYLSKLQKCGITTTDIGASVKLKYDITKIFDRNVDWEEFRFNYNIYSGSKSEENFEVCSNWNVDLQKTYGLEEYEYFKPESDGFYVTDQNALNELQKRSAYFAYADFNFRPRDYALARAKGYNSDNTPEELNGHYRIGWTSEETPYTIVKMNKITVVKDINAKNAAGDYTDVEEYFYPANTNVTLMNPTRSGGWYCDGLYEKTDFTGNPISSISKENNTTDRVLYAKWGLIFSDLDNQNINKMQLDMKELKPDFNETLKQDDFVAITLSGHAESDFSGPIRFQIWNNALWDTYDNVDWPSLRGKTVINQSIKAGQDFTMCFGLKVQHPWHDEYNNDPKVTVPIKPEDLFIQIEYDKNDYEPEFKISNPQITFDSNPLMYKYVLSGAAEDVSYGVFVKNEKKVLPTELDRWDMLLADWYDNPDCTGSPIKEVAANDNDPKTFYAKWNMKFEHDEYNHNHHAYFNIKDYQNAFDTQIALPEVPENAQDNKMIVYVAELTGTPNIDFHGSMSANIHIPSRHRNNGDEVCICSPSDVFQGDSGHWTINDLTAGQEVTIKMPLRDWVNAGEGGYTVEPEDMNFYIEYWDSDCNENLILSDWKLEIKPAIEIYYKLDEDDQFRKDGAFVADNMEARRYGYYTEDDADSNGAITLLTSVERPGFSRKLDGWGRYTWNETLNNGEGDWEWHDVDKWKYSDGSVELRPKWSLVFTEGHYENHETHNTSYNYGTDLTLNSIDYWKDRENVADEWGNVWNCGNKPNLKYGDHISITLEGEPTANIPPSQYGIIAQLYDKKWNEENSSWISMDAYCENILEKGNRARLVFDFDVPWTSEHNYEDLAIRFVYDTGTQKIHNNGIGLILSDYNIWYDILSEKVSVTYDYGYKKETTQVYKDGWYELPTDFGDMHEYFEREFEGWYITDIANYQGCVEERDFDKRVGWDCLKADGTTYKAKWNYKMMEGGYKDNGWDDEQGVHHTSETDRQWFFTYDTRISSDEFAEHPSGNIDKDKWYVLVVEGYSNANLNGIELSIDGWDKEGDVDYDTNYTVLRDESALFNLQANQNFKFVTKIKPYKTVMSYDYDAKLWKNSLTYCDEPTLSNVKIRLFEFDDEDAADIKITEIDAEQ